MSELSLLAFPQCKIHRTDLCWDNGAAAHHIGSRRLPPIMQIVQRKHCKHTSGGNWAVNHIKIPQKGGMEREFSTPLPNPPPVTCWCWYTGNLFSSWHYRWWKSAVCVALGSLLIDPAHLSGMRLSGRAGCHRGSFLTSRQTIQYSPNNETRRGIHPIIILIVWKICLCDANTQMLDAK